MSNSKLTSASGMDIIKTTAPMLAFTAPDAQGTIESMDDHDEPISKDALSPIFAQMICTSLLGAPDLATHFVESANSINEEMKKSKGQQRGYGFDVNGYAAIRPHRLPVHAGVESSVKDYNEEVMGINKRDGLGDEASPSLSAPSKPGKNR